MAEEQTTEKHYITLPFGAFREDGTISTSPFFPGRQTYQLSTPGQNGELYWLVVRNFNGLLFPRFTTEDTVLREFGVFQEGGTTVLLKAPIRNFTVDITVKAGQRISYTDARRKLAYIIAWSHSTASVPPEFEEINEIYNISTIWGRPNPFTYTIVRGDGTPYHIDCFVQTVDPQDDSGNPDSNTLDTVLRLTADNPTIYGNELQETISGKVGAGTRTEPESTPSFLLGTGILNSPINYSLDTLASARTGFRVVLPLPNLTPSPTTLYSFGVYEANTTKWARFKYFGYPSTGWTLPAGYNSITFDSVQRIFTATDGTTPIALDLQSSPQSLWDNFLLQPGKTYNFFVEVDVGISSRIATGTLTYRPRWGGI